MFLSGFIQKPLSGFDVLALGAFVSACEQQEQGVLLGGAIYAVSGSEVEPQFQNLPSHVFEVGGLDAALLDLVCFEDDSRFRLFVFEFREPALVLSGG